MERGEVQSQGGDALAVAPFLLRGQVDAQDVEDLVLREGQRPLVEQAGRVQVGRVPRREGMIATEDLDQAVGCRRLGGRHARRRRPALLRPGRPSPKLRLRQALDGEQAGPNAPHGQRRDHVAPFRHAIDRQRRDRRPGDDAYEDRRPPPPGAVRQTGRQVREGEQAAREDRSGKYVVGAEPVAGPANRLAHERRRIDDDDDGDRQHDRRDEGVMQGARRVVVSLVHATHPRRTRRPAPPALTRSGR